MAFVPGGSDIAVKINPLNRKLRRIWDTTGPNKGNPRFDSTQEHAVYISIFARRNQYWADTTGTFGSLVYTLLQDLKATPAKFVSYATDGLAPLVIAGKIAANPAIFAEREFDRMNTLVQYKTQDGRPQEARPSLPIT